LRHGQDRTVRNLSDQPRDPPTGTAFGVAFLTCLFFVFAFGADRIEQMRERAK
jgi:hypothetical protein